MTRLSSVALAEFAQALLGAAGLEPAHAGRVAGTLVAADLLGHGSHGIRLLPRYLDEVRDGRMTPTGSPEVVSDNGTAILLDGRMLQGPVVVAYAVERALDRLGRHGTVITVIRRSSHIAALCTYLEMATARGAMMLIASSNPWAKLVAPFRGQRPVYSPNPIAFGIPTGSDPILIDFSAATISANVVQEYGRRGELLPGEYLLDAAGHPTRDPNALGGARPGAILPLGGVDLGHKGFGLGLIVEGLTAGLGGFGRTNEPQASNNAVFVLLIDPWAFGGRDFLEHEIGSLAAACRGASGPGDAVRLPGERALAHRRQAMIDGLVVEDMVLNDLLRRAAALGVPRPAAASPLTPTTPEDRPHV